MGVNEKLLKACQVARACFQSGGGGNGRTVRLEAPGASRTARGWLTSLGVLRLTNEDFQFRVLGLGLPSKEAVLDSNFPLSEGVNGDWTGQTGGSG